jgi:hypothetical protein
MKALRPPPAASPVAYLFRFRVPHDSSAVRVRFIHAPEQLEVPHRARILVRPAIPLVRLAHHVDVSGTSQVPRRSVLCLCSGLGPRPSRRSLAIAVSSMLPLLFRRQRLQRLTYRGYRGASVPAVYASWGMLPLPMQDSLPAGWLAFAGREFNPLDRDERFPSCYIPSPFPGFILTLRNPSQ